MDDEPERLVLQPGTLVFSAGDVASTAYVILKGRVVLRTDHNGAEQRVERQTGEMLGETAILGDGPHRSTATTLDECELLAVGRRQLLTRLEAVDPLVRVWVSSIVDRYREVATAPASRPVLSSVGMANWAAQSAAARAALSSEDDLRRAIERAELELHFQPIVALRSRKLAGFEALLRWRHPVRGLLQPDDFVPLAEARGLIPALTASCLKLVAQQFPTLIGAAKINAAAVDETLFLTVNVSGLDLEREEFPASAVAILTEGGVDPRDVHLEITETVLMKNADQCARTLQRLRDYGMHIAIDDFGTGYSSLNYLNALPASFLKLDRSFAHSLLADATGRKIIAAILHLGTELDMTVIAEGIEHESEAALLTSLGCHLGQGYLFGRPAPLRDTIARIGGWGRQTTPKPVLDLRRA